VRKRRCRLACASCHRSAACVQRDCSTATSPNWSRSASCSRWSTTSCCCSFACPYAGDPPDRRNHVQSTWIASRDHSTHHPVRRPPLAGQSPRALASIADRPRSAASYGAVARDILPSDRTHPHPQTAVAYTESGRNDPAAVRTRSTAGAGGHADWHGQRHADAWRSAC